MVGEQTMDGGPNSSPVVLGYLNTPSNGYIIDTRVLS